MSIYIYICIYSSLFFVYLFIHTHIRSPKNNVTVSHYMVPTSNNYYHPRRQQPQQTCVMTSASISDPQESLWNLEPLARHRVSSRFCRAFGAGAPKGDCRLPEMLLKLVWRLRLIKRPCACRRTRTSRPQRAKPPTPNQEQDSKP